MTVGEGGIRVPLIVAGPGVDSGRRTDAFAYVWDILPTLMEVTGVEYPAEFNGRPVEAPLGRSMLGLLDGSAETIYNADEYVGGEMGSGKWMRQGDLKAVSVPPPYGTGEWQLFNVVVDPGEANDLSAEVPEKLEELKAAWERYASDVGVVPGG